jgi:hypothetical protein
VELIWTGFFVKLCRHNQTDPLPKGAKVEEMTKQEELIQEIRERLGEMPMGALPFDLLGICHHYRTTLLVDGRTKSCGLL